MARTTLAALALLLCAGAALAALDCSSLAGCNKCSYDTNKKGLQLLCTECESEAYALKEKKGRCGARLVEASLTPRETLPFAPGCRGRIGTVARACVAAGLEGMCGLRPLHLWHAVVRWERTAHARFTATRPFRPLTRTLPRALGCCLQPPRRRRLRRRLLQPLRQRHAPQPLRAPARQRRRGPRQGGRQREHPVRPHWRLFVYTFVCMYVCMYVCMCVHLCVCVCVCVCV